MSEQRLPRLGDREDIRIEVLPAAVSTYRQSRLESAGVELTDTEAEEELEDVLRESYVTYSSGDTMRVRGRVRRLEVDAESELIRVSTTRVRCIFARARRLDTRIQKAGSGRGLGGHDVRDLAGRRMGYLRVTSSGALEWRPVADTSGAPAPPWGPPDFDFRALAREQERAGKPRTAQWLRRQGIDIEKAEPPTKP